MIFRNNFEDEVPNGLPYYMQLLYICFEQENAIYANRLIKWIYEQDITKEKMKLHNELFLQHLCSVCSTNFLA